MPAYVIADVQVTDPAGYEAYKRGVPETISAHQGRYLVRGGDTTLLEGDWLPRRMVVLEFPTSEARQAWYDSTEYQALRAIREKTARSHLIFVDGI